MPTASPYEGIGELRELASVDEANGLLKTGCVLVKVIEKTNTDGSTSVVYILGRLREGQQLSRQPTTTQDRSTTQVPAKPQTGGTSPEQKALESLKWTKFEDGKGEWAFYLNAAGDLLEDLEPARALVEKMRVDEKLRVPVGKFTYKIKGRFLNRFPAK